MEDFKSITSNGIRSRRNYKQKAVCRVCLKKSKGMINIFDITKDLSVSIADMISQCTGFHIFKGDSFPETICPPCLQDAKNAFEIKHTYEGSHQFFLQLNQNSKARKDLLEEENCVQGTQQVQVKTEGIDNFLEESAPQIEYFQIDEYFPEEMKSEQIEEYFPGEVINELVDEYLPGEVLNEPIEEDPFEEDDGESLDYDIDPSYLQDKCDGSDNYDDDNEQCPNLCIRNGANITNADEIPFQCSACPRQFPTLSQLKLHGFAHSEPTFKCDFCETAFVHQSSLIQHVRRHTGERPFKCSLCQQDFTTKQQFSVHFKSHPQNPLFKCSLCELAFSSQEELEPHIKTHTGKQLYNCSHCQRVFHNQKVLKNHIRSTHMEKTSQTKEAKLKSLPERSFKCSHCDKSFNRNQALVLHIKFIHHTQPIKCSYCKKTFRRKKDLTLHNKKKHLRMSVKVS